MRRTRRGSPRRSPAGRRSPSTREELRLAEPVVAADEREHDRAVVLRDRHRLRRRGEVDAEELAERLARRDARRLDLLRPVQRRGELGTPRDALRDLGVGRVVAALAADERVLAGAGGREEVDGQLAAHDPALRLHRVGLDAAAVEDPVVRLAVALEARERALLVAVERVRVLHDELADAEQAAARPRLVAVLDGEVVPELGQLLVRADLARVEGERLLVRHRQHELTAVPVGQVEELGDLVAAGRLPELERASGAGRATPGRRSRPSPRG